MKIDAAVQALEDGKTVNSANAQATIKPVTREGQARVLITRTTSKGAEDVMDMTLSRMRQLYRAHDFAEGQYKAPSQKKASAPAENK